MRIVIGIHFFILFVFPNLIKLLILAFEVAEKNKISDRFVRNIKMAGKKWLSGFRSRYPEISLRQTEATSAARALALNKLNVKKFFTTYEKVMLKERIDAFNVKNV